MLWQLNNNMAEALPHPLLLNWNQFVIHLQCSQPTMYIDSGIKLNSRCWGSRTADCSWYVPFGVRILIFGSNSIFHSHWDSSTHYRQTFFMNIIPRNLRRWKKNLFKNESDELFRFSNTNYCAKWLLWPIWVFIL